MQLSLQEAADSSKSQNDLKRHISETETKLGSTRSRHPSASHSSRHIRREQFTDRLSPSPDLTKDLEHNEIIKRARLESCDSLDTDTSSSTKESFQSRRMRFLRTAEVSTVLYFLYFWTDIKLVNKTVFQATGKCAPVCD